MAKIIINNLTKIYGNNPEKALELMDKGLSNNEIRQETKQVVGVRETSFTVDEGESFVIMGLSGSGKSTLLRCINMLIAPSRGEILIDGEDVTRVSSDRLMQLRRKKMSMIFQNFAEGDDGGAVLVVVEDGNVALFLQLPLDFKAAGGGDVLQVDAAEGEI